MTRSAFMTYACWGTVIGLVGYQAFIREGVERRRNERRAVELAARSLARSPLRREHERRLAEMVDADLRRCADDFAQEWPLDELDRADFYEDPVADELESLAALPCVTPRRI